MGLPGTARVKDFPIAGKDRRLVLLVYPVFNAIMNLTTLATQDQTSHHFAVVDGPVERPSVPFRYALSSELDLMTQLVGGACASAWQLAEGAVHERA